jgi:hypothetical protein
MTIVMLGGRYYIPVENGFKEISYVQAMDLYESGEVTNEVDLSHEYD